MKVEKLMHCYDKVQLLKVKGTSLRELSIVMSTAGCLPGPMVRQYWTSHRVIFLMMCSSSAMRGQGRLELRGVGKRGQGHLINPFILW